MIGIIVAIDEEVETLIKNSKVIDIETDNVTKFYHIVIGKQDVILAKSGAGKVNASMTVTKIIEKYNLKYIINTGIAGGIGSLKIGSLVIGDSAVYFDVNMSSHRHKYKYGQVRELPLEFKANRDLVAKLYKYCDDKSVISYIGTIATGDHFVNNLECLKNIIEEIPNITAVDMESAAIAHVCSLNNIPFALIRVISDIVTEDYKEDEFALNINEACTELGKRLIEYISMEDE
ncbi:5'-methylthioadenosine/adenosylhomocysteine nucleosidase [Herbivorax sp. ANBcel31]|uniref:5'-methylthioadenosine/adenosylhomocysteine nucleosidase n=1 Tax=Herbivorax sp. ANBcel31 TaxID=3069754 RepID=UPI0027B12BC7|nr:5'-methylthioadenosine/adenosylhomocysteine nucleosidase [Herbivorax sp. ANBcel31]MDQ2088205.1 5'-methylthioadenosine/adenosylhomocysteine nucleosidase [Herbivorax sp. ANBcel31]